MPELYSSNQPKEEVKKTTKREFLPPQSGHCLSSLLILPKKGVHFDTQDPEEEILLILRRHWITNLPWFFIALVLFFAPAVLTFFPLLASFPEKYRFVFVIVWYLITLMFIFEKFLAWLFNMTIITDERIIDIDFVNLTTKKISDCELDKIQDVSFNNSGAFGTIFNYGDVTVQTAAEIVEFVFEDIPRPAKVAEILQKLRTEEKIEALEGRIR
ncbi:hypothetical protein COS55_02440 [Candidatus Shapirobacteria bacterium CG03_land_8_20_14_0_80_40_19]|uniref:YdbS-like PH domain-containing protein n=4 Tax=Candidatus Shapironibacteriota TaxID=1752721 RepID=A0A2M7BDD4_9BACT|nr:MAG: hypothetical protein COV89_00170 [Candidatus Shapirobacteria bacterium CG11_big_fil_rev_8_21_14_0_20_40_12]PIV01122.1 MAG: hypothetical protein COS55_02440 [Candidatus Shapirobacteria bacterium CG03_land_8_20_14_0_80_40_19]PJC28572.1 MAG: hypothetical protein CO053_03880 [Candidatus Shapirobacteria bacterium CG_4_9_14_0_2_um_filter_40_11]PJC76877.1 MAG: hypothetical protein CO010_01480 [Candidatus Shapirobacteria bacterium CG_4_8_14_3_um_filter_39_11]